MYYRSVGSGPVSEEEALQVKCPRCQQPAGERCVYTTPERVVIYGGRWGQRNDLRWREGDRRFTQRVHNERRDAADAVRRRKWLKAHTPKVVPASRNAREAARAMMRWDREEWESLHEWLRRHGSIFKEGTHAVQGDVPQVP